MDESNPKRIALLIDGDNAQPSLVTDILTETAKYGSITIRRTYGDWTTPSMNGWKTTLNNHAIQPVQQFRYTVGKNATDSAMIIDAMDILHSDLVDGFCLVSSDSDYTRLATRIRESGVFVMGIGKKLTPKAFVNACNVFIYTEILTSGGAVQRKSGSRKGESRKSGREELPDPLPLLRQAFEMATQEDDTANLATFGFYLHQLDPGFDPRTYGYRQLIQLVKAYPDVFQIQPRGAGGTGPVMLRMKE